MKIVASFENIPIAYRVSTNFEIWIRGPCARNLIEAPIINDIEYVIGEP